MWFDRPVSRPVSGSIDQYLSKYLDRSTNISARIWIDGSVLQPVSGSRTRRLSIKINHFILYVRNELATSPSRPCSCTPIIVLPRQAKQKLDSSRTPNLASRDLIPAYLAPGRVLSCRHRVYPDEIKQLIQREPPKARSLRSKTIAS